MTAAAERSRPLRAASPATQWQRTGSRSDGATFTVDTFARYHLHDLVHHAHDVSHITKRVTVASYDASAEAYAAGAARRCPDDVRRRSTRSSRCCRAGARVLEVGSGSGRDALALEERGCPSAAPTSRRLRPACCAQTATTPTWSTR